MSVPYSWTVYVQLRWPDGTIPTNQQISQILAFESYGGNMQELCAAGLGANGLCTWECKITPWELNTLIVRVGLVLGG